MKYYTGIGSRTCPILIIQQMRTLGAVFADLGWTLRSGGANGADTAFEEGCDSRQGKKEIYLPWRSFQGNSSNLYNISSEALEVAEEIYGPSFKYLKRPVKLLMSRNMYQVMGENLDMPSELVVCYTEDECQSSSQRTKKTGGTGQAISYASRQGIPIFNLAISGRIEDLINYVSSYNQI